MTICYNIFQDFKEQQEELKQQLESSLRKQQLELKILRKQQEMQEMETAMKVQRLLKQSEEERKSRVGGANTGRGGASTGRGVASGGAPGRGGTGGDKHQRARSQSSMKINQVNWTKKTFKSL